MTEVVNNSDITQKMSCYFGRKPEKSHLHRIGYSRTNPQIRRIGGEHVVAGQYSNPVVIDTGHDSGYLNCV